MSAGLRGNLSLDLRRTAARAPLELRLNGGYYIDQSSKVVEQLENGRLNKLISGGQTPPMGSSGEYRHLATRNERLAYNVNRVDHASIALGLEAPLALSKNVALHPIAEWELWIPVNRQDYKCPTVGTGIAPAASPGPDGCVKQEGAGSWPQRFVAGARLYPALAGFSLLAAVEVGINGMNNFTREFAPTAPWRVLLGASYNFDLAPDRSAEPPPPVVVPVAPKQGRLRGRVIDRDARTPVSGARVAVAGSAVSGPGSELSSITQADGEFVTADLPVGSVSLTLEAEGYEPGSCTGSIPEQGGDVGVVCELAALPRVGTLAGRVVGTDGAPIAGVTVQLIGPITRSPLTQADGSFRELDLTPGEYQARIDDPSFLMSITPVQIELRKESTLQLVLIAKPQKPLVQIQKTRLKLGDSVYFSTGTADLETRSEPLLTEVADALLRTPSILRVEIQGHTDNVGKREFNADLAQRRAESVRSWLMRAGVAGERLEAKGYGQTKPVTSNKNEKGRARNRRVEFIILERAAQ
jgi:outer membrane protein OmpA-like peptidoglycan-associated protein